jgi:hypothetical protein
LVRDGCTYRLYKLKETHTDVPFVPNCSTRKISAVFVCRLPPPNLLSSKALLPAGLCLGYIIKNWHIQYVSSFGNFRASKMAKFQTHFAVHGILRNGQYYVFHEKKVVFCKLYTCGDQPERWYMSLARSFLTSFLS